MVSYQIRVVVAEIAVGSPELARARLVGMYYIVKPEVAVTAVVRTTDDSTLIFFPLKNKQKAMSGERS